MRGRSWAGQCVVLVLAMGGEGLRVIARGGTRRRLLHAANVKLALRQGVWNSLHIVFFQHGSTLTLTQKIHFTEDLVPISWSLSTQESSPSFSSDPDNRHAISHTPFALSSASFILFTARAEAMTTTCRFTRHAFFNE